MRFRERMKVDFPQPLGPMIAVTALEAISSVTLSMARLPPYQIERFFIRNVHADTASSARIGSAGLSTWSITLRSGVVITKLSIREDAKRQTLNAPELEV